MLRAGAAGLLLLAEGPWLCDTLYALGLREAHELPEQMDRLLRCTLRFDGWVSELSWLRMLGWDDVYDDRWRGVIPQRDTRVALCGPLTHEMLRHPVRLCMHTLRGLKDSAFALDVYLWDAWRRVGPEPSPPQGPKAVRGARRARLAIVQRRLRHRERSARRPWSR